MDSVIGLTALAAACGLLLLCLMVAMETLKPAKHGFNDYLHQRHGWPQSVAIFVAGAVSTVVIVMSLGILSAIVVQAVALMRAALVG